MTQDRGDWIQTYGGRQFWPVVPAAADLNIDDIAHALSLQCRFAGHCLRFYSVAEHCVLLSRAVSPVFALDALMHDASEAYLVDVPRPLKPSLTGYRELEDRLQNLIASHYGLTWPHPDEVTHADRRILTDEMRQNMAAPPVPWSTDGELLGVNLQLWSPQRAEAEFLERFHELRS